MHFDWSVAHSEVVELKPLLRDLQKPFCFELTWLPILPFLYSCGSPLRRYAIEFVHQPFLLSDQIMPLIHFGAMHVTISGAQLHRMVSSDAFVCACVFSDVLLQASRDPASFLPTKLPAVDTLFGSNEEVRHRNTPFCTLQVAIAS